MSTCSACWIFHWLEHFFLFILFHLFCIIFAARAFRFCSHNDDVLRDFLSCIGFCIFWIFFCLVSHMRHYKDQNQDTKVFRLVRDQRTHPFTSQTSVKRKEEEKWKKKTKYTPKKKVYKNENQISVKPNLHKKRVLFSGILKHMWSELSMQSIQ